MRIWHQRYIRFFTYLFAVLLAVSIFLIPFRPKESEVEKRELSRFPKLSVTGIVTGSWFSGINTWFSDTFPLRDKLSVSKSMLQNLYGLKGEELQGNVYIANNRGYRITHFDEDTTETYASMLNTVHSLLGDGVQIYDLLAPTSFSVCLDEETQLSLGGSGTRDAFNHIYSLLDDSIVKVPVADALVKHNAEYIFFNTDHHWTQLGAYYAYLEFCTAKGLTPHALSEFKESQYPNFLGSFYTDSNQSTALRANMDTLHTYTPNRSNECTISDCAGYDFTAPVVGEGSDYSAGNKYKTFISSDNALTTINNPAIADGSSCVVVKDSYGNAFVPFLVDHYQTVYVVDYRYYPDDLTTFIRQNNVKDVLFINNADAIPASDTQKMLDLFQ